MKVIGIRRDPAQGEVPTARIRSTAWAILVNFVPQADIVALTCALTPETTGLMSAAAFKAMKPVVGVRSNVARGKVADEAALLDGHEGQQDAAGGARHRWLSRSHCRRVLRRCGRLPIVFRYAPHGGRNAWRLRGAT